MWWRQTGLASIFCEAIKVVETLVVGSWYHRKPSSLWSPPRLRVYPVPIITPPQKFEELRDNLLKLRGVPTTSNSKELVLNQKGTTRHQQDHVLQNRCQDNWKPFKWSNMSNFNTTNRSHNSFSYMSHVCFTILFKCWKNTAAYRLLPPFQWTTKHNETPVNTCRIPSPFLAQKNNVFHKLAVVKKGGKLWGKGRGAFHPKPAAWELVLLSFSIRLNVSVSGSRRLAPKACGIKDKKRAVWSNRNFSYQFLILPVLRKIALEWAFPVSFLLFKIFKSKTMLQTHKHASHHPPNQPKKWQTLMTETAFIAIGATALREMAAGWPVGVRWLLEAINTLTLPFFPFDPC